MLKLNLRKGFWLRLIILIAGMACVTAASAAATGVTLSGIQTQVGKSISTISALLEDISLITGIGFIMASFFKFHAHKNNPTQVPISQGIVLLVIGAGLAVFPHLLNTTSQGVFGTNIEKVGGTAITGIIKSS
ncbi:MAG: type IV secretion protein IcmD [Gammaproteobacteria bacterium]|nr:type IV secretion protein IcmD [Gammaproteobacteria bacterium]